MQSKEFYTAIINILDKRNFKDSSARDRESKWNTQKSIIYLINYGLFADQ